MDNQLKLRCEGQDCLFIVESAYAATDHDEHDYIEFFCEDIYLVAPVSHSEVPKTDPDDLLEELDFSLLVGREYRLIPEMIGQDSFVNLPDKGICAVLGGKISFTRVVSLGDGEDPLWEGKVSIKFDSDEGMGRASGSFSTTFLAGF